MNIFKIIFKNYIFYYFLYILKYIITMCEIAKNAFASRNYLLAAEMYERCMKDQQTTSTYEIYFGYANSLAKCGKIREALQIYSNCYQKFPQQYSSNGTEHLKHFSNALLESIIQAGNFKSVTPKVINSLSCVLCEDMLNQPVTFICGHTVCKKCEIKDLKSKNCKKCGQPKSQQTLEINVLFKNLSEKLWPNLLNATKFKEEGNELFQNGHLEEALFKYNQACELAPESAPVLSNRSHVLLRLNRPQLALQDAELACKLRPYWGKAQYRRGMALAALGRLEEALLAFGCCVTLDRSPNAVRHEIATVLHRLLIPTVQCRRGGVSPVRGPYWRDRRLSTGNSGPFLRTPSPSSRYLTTRRSRGSSDCEDESSGDEDVHMTQVSEATHRPSKLETNHRLDGILDRLLQNVEKIKRCDIVNCDEGTSWVAQAIGPVEPSDFDCVLCCRLLWRPVTTPCGHTYCWTCLDRCLDYSHACPLCMAPLADYLASNQRAVTELIDFALQTLLPQEYTARQSQNEAELRAAEADRDSRVPVFVCTTAFPSVPCPLFVYEPRYRLMVRRAVESGNRQFGIAACVDQHATGQRRYGEFGTMLEIRDQVCMASGCSILATVGQRRFKVIEGGENDGYDLAKVEYLSDEAISQDNLPGVSRLHELVRCKASFWLSTLSETAQKEVSQTFGAMPEPEQDWMNLPDGPSWAWWLLGILPLGNKLKVGILGTTNLEKRLRAIDKTLDHLARQRMKSVTENQQVSEAKSSSSEQL